MGESLLKELGGAERPSRLNIKSLRECQKCRAPFENHGFQESEFSVFEHISIIFHCFDLKRSFKDALTLT